MDFDAELADVGQHPGLDDRWQGQSFVKLDVDFQIVDDLTAVTIRRQRLVDGR
jgi:hypothetical protein